VGDPGFSAQRRMGLLGGLGTIFMGAGGDGFISQHLSIQIETSRTQVEFVLAKVGIIETILSNLSIALAEFGSRFKAWNISGISWNYVVLGFLRFVSVRSGIRGSVHVFSGPSKEFVIGDLGLSVVNGFSGVVVVSKVRHL